MTPARWPTCYRRSFREADISLDAALNAVAVTATLAQQQRIADAIAQLDASPGAQTPTGVQNGAMGNGSPEVVTPDGRVLQLPTPGQIALVGPPASMRTARGFLDKVDVVAPLVVLDTEVLELDESVAKNLGPAARNGSDYQHVH